MAFTKEEKKALVGQYERLLKDSHAIFVMSYSKMSMANVNAVRSAAREFGGEIHVVKNTLMKIALKNTGYVDSDLFNESSVVGFALGDVPGLAKVLNKTIKEESFFALKGFKPLHLLIAQPCALPTSKYFRGPDHGIQ